MSAGRLTTHVLDTANGHPARAMTIELYKGTGAARTLVKSVVTNSDGRCDGPLLEDTAFEAGAYELRFHVGDYFAELDGTPAAFLDVVPVRFIVSDPEAHYHVPLLVSPFGYSTYRGS